MFDVGQWWIPSVMVLTSQYLVDPVETESGGGGVKSHYFSCGASPWECEEDKEQDNILSVNQVEELLISHNSNSQEKVRS